MVKQFTVADCFSGCGGSSLGWKLANFKELLAVEFDSDAIATFRMNFPEVNLFAGDIAKLSGEEALRITGLKPGELDVFGGSPPCFVAGTLITTEKGVVPIEEMTPGMRCLTHSGRYQNVLETMQKAYSGDILNISFRYGRKPVQCTPEHPFYARRRTKVGDRKQYSEPEWIDASDLRPGDVVCEPHTKDWTPLCIPKIVKKQSVQVSGSSKHKTGKFLKRLVEEEFSLDWTTKEIAWILGFYLAEGHTRGVNPTLEEDKPCRREVIFSIADHEAEFISEKIRGLGFHPQVQKHSQGSTRITITNIELWALCQVVGKKAYGKFIPETFLSMPVEWQKEFLDGYFTGDGDISPNGKSKNSTRRKATTVSRRIAEGVARMVSRVFGVVASIQVIYLAGKTTIQGRKVNVRDTFSVGYILPGSETTRPSFVDEIGSWLPIKSISKENTSCIVYNMEVEEDNSYIANGFAVHNCQSYSTAGKRKLNDPRGQLFLEYSRLLSTFKPKVFVFENVTGMVKGHMKQEYLKVINHLRECGYKAKGQVMNAKFYNVPQSRERVIIIGVRDDLGIEPSHPKPQSVPITPREAFKGLTDDSGKEFPDWLKKAASEMPAGNYSSKYAKEAFLKHKGNTSSAISFQLLSWDRTAPTVTKSWIASSGIGHPNKQRFLNLSELKRLASFPDEFQFPGDFTKGLARIGNCVPPNMMKAIAEHIRDEILSKV